MRRLLAGTVVLLLAASTACPTNADDSTIAQQLSADLRAAKTNSELKSFRINVKVDDGVVWMQGSVLDIEQRSRALNIARAVPGVRLVVNDLVLADDVVPDVAPPNPKRREAKAGAEPKAEVGQEKVAAYESTIQSPHVSQPRAKANSRNTFVSPAAAMAGTAVTSASDLGMSQQPQVQPTPPTIQPMQAQMIRTQLLQREIAESRAIAAATEQLRRQNAIARNQLANYCANGGCNAGGDATAGAGASYGGPIASETAGCYPGGSPAVGGYGGEFGGADYGGVYGGGSGSDAGVVYDQAQLPGYAWPSYASYPNYAALSYPKQYSPQAWPYIGPFYPYPQVPLGWRKVCLEWDDGWWMLDFTSKGCH